MYYSPQLCILVVWSLFATATSPSSFDFLGFQLLLPLSGSKFSSLNFSLGAAPPPSKNWCFQQLHKASRLLLLILCCSSRLQQPPPLAVLTQFLGTVVQRFACSASRLRYRRQAVTVVSSADGWPDTSATDRSRVCSATRSLLDAQQLWLRRASLCRGSKHSTSR